MLNNFTRKGMAHLTPYPKKKKDPSPTKSYSRVSEEKTRQTIADNARMSYQAEMERQWIEQQRQLARELMFGTSVRRSSQISYYDDFGNLISSSTELISNPCAEIESPVEKKVEPHVKKIRNPKGYKHDRGFTGNHQHVQYLYESGEKYGPVGSLAISDSIGGCGMQQLYDWTAISTPEIADQLISEMFKDLHQDTGLIICQVGANYYEHVFTKALEKAGFTYPIEYKNFTHGANGKYTQRVYTFQVPDKVPGSYSEPDYI